jgi:hypothetical protein
MRAANVSEDGPARSTLMPQPQDSANKPALILFTTLNHTSAMESKAGCPINPMDETSTADYEYTRLHSEMWPFLVRHTDAECLNPNELDSWMRLWGRLGLEFFQLSIHGDDCIRNDMMRRAMSNGSWRGHVIAKRLSSWAEELRVRGPRKGSIQLNASA